ncbi:polyphosphate--glucose phosphotransferase [Ilumatobacter sp.]|uniref:polyphosphate--glucose phosphotransferase n=1 Tax=Ilumatobacter sp. TaxID=1967498 RepID=UPI003AF99CFF
MATRTRSFGIDIGGSGMKAAPVDVSDGSLAADRLRIDTPQPATPKAMAKVVRKLVAHHDWDGPVGVCMPSVVTNGVVRSAANIDPSWLDVDADALFTQAVGHPVSVVNDADAAGVAEMRWGSGRGRSGVVICLTFGTGIGSGLFVDGVLVPNTELGHLELDGPDIEKRAAASARDREGLSWEEWGDRVDRYLTHVVMLFSPELIILGGGASKKPERWVHRLDPGCEVAIAEMANNAGIAGAALLAPEPGALRSARE